MDFYEKKGTLQERDLMGKQRNSGKRLRNLGFRDFWKLLGSNNGIGITIKD
jgi:hypothetical protein